MRVASPVVLIALAACGNQPDRPSKLTLVDLGAEPRVELRYAFGKLERDISFVSRIDDDKAREKLGDAVFGDMRYHLSCDGAAGRCSYRMTKFTVLGEGSNFESVRKDIRGVMAVPPSGPIRVTADGITYTTPSTPELLKLAVVPLPGAAVGEGATWEVTDGVVRRRFRLVKNHGRTLTVETSQSAGNAQATVETTGMLTVSLADPFAKGTAATVQTHAADPSIKMGGMTMRHTYVIE